MKSIKYLLLLLLLATAVACTSTAETITSSASGEVITDIQARGTGGGSQFDGEVNSTEDLENLVDTAWGVARLGLHRGHGPIEAVLEAFLGINHDEMHVLMEDEGLNLAQICERFGFDPENLVDTLTASFVPFVEEGAANGVITAEEAELWTERIRTEFSNRVYWEG